MDREVVYAQIANEMLGLLSRVEQVAGERFDLRPLIYKRVKGLVADLADRERRMGAARTIMAALYPATDPPLEFWSTDLGIEIAAAIGYHRERVPLPTCAAILGVTRQRVHQLCESGLLTRIQGEYAVVPASLRDHLHLYGRRPSRRRSGRPPEGAGA